MLPPSMDYEVGKGRQYELERKAANNRLVEEALAGRSSQKRGFRARFVAFLMRARYARVARMPVGPETERI